MATCITRRFAPILLAATLVLPFLPATPALAAPMYGHDISWPQCSVADGGFGHPLPPASSQFVIVGVNGFDPNATVKQGLPFFENPCLAWQLQQTTTKPRHAYTVAGFPTAAQLSTYGSAGPWSSATRAGRLSNVGYAEARFVLTTLQRVGWSPPVVWIDVEPRITQPWPTATPAQQRENRYVLEGMMRGLRDANVAYGVYSYAGGWSAITGSWRLPGVPVWATAGRLDYPSEALEMCTRPSFSGGKVVLSQWYDDTRDYDLTCDPYRFTPLAMPPSALSNTTNEFDEDWNNDLIARERTTGYLWLYPGDGRSGWLPRVRIGTGWLGLDQLDTVGDFNGDGTLDIVARNPSTGELWLYPGNGRGGWLPRVRIGSGWNVMNALVGPGDWNGDGYPDLLARERATGHLWLYPGNGRGGWLPRVRIGSGWNVMNALVGPGDWNGDRTADLLARETATGYLWLYPGNGRGGWLPRVRIGSGWNVMNALVGPGDWNGDRTADLLARETATGYLWLYPGNGRGGWLPRVRIGSGWNVMNALL
jgi:hypothetical protein